MESELNKIIEAMPREVCWKDIVDFSTLDERLSAISVLFANIVGVCENYIEFCPDNEPPLMEEKLSWIWLYRPDLSDALLKLELSDDFRILIKSYKLSKMDKFWEYMS